MSQPSISSLLYVSSLWESVLSTRFTTYSSEHSSTFYSWISDTVSLYSKWIRSFSDNSTEAQIGVKYNALIEDLLSY